MEKPPQNHSARMEVALVEAARFLGGQPFVPSSPAAQFPYRLIFTECRTGVHSGCPPRRNYAHLLLSASGDSNSGNRLPVARGREATPRASRESQETLDQ